MNYRMDASTPRHQDNSYVHPFIHSFIRRGGSSVRYNNSSTALQSTSGLRVSFIRTPAGRLRNTPPSYVAYTTEQKQKQQHCVCVRAHTHTHTYDRMHQLLPRLIATAGTLLCTTQTITLLFLRSAPISGIMLRSESFYPLRQVRLIAHYQSRHTPVPELSDRSPVPPLPPHETPNTRALHDDDDDDDIHIRRAHNSQATDSLHVYRPLENSLRFLGPFGEQPLGVVLGGHPLQGEQPRRALVVRAPALDALRLELLLQLRLRFSRYIQYISYDDITKH